MTCVNETKLLRQLKRGSTAALSEIIELYTPYVYAIASNVMRPMLPAEDVEEAVSDCFTALWYNRDSVEPGKAQGLPRRCGAQQGSERAAVKAHRERA